MESHTPKSSHIKDFAYSPHTRQLKVTFSTTGESYTHTGFPPDAWEALKRFWSAGTYYHRFVKNRYKLLTTKV